MKIKSSLIAKGNFLRPMYVAGARNNKNGSVDREGRGHAQGERTFTNLGFLQPENTADISWRHWWFPRNYVWEMSAEIPYWWRTTTQIWVVPLIGWKFDSSNQKHYPDLGSDTSSVWDFYARSSDVISRGNQWLRRKTSAVFSGYGSWIFSLFIILYAHRNYNIIIIIFVIFTQRCQAKGF